MQHKLLAYERTYAALPSSSVEAKRVSPAVVWAYYLVRAAALWPVGNRKKVAHHGYETSTTYEFLEVIRPGLAVISLGKDNTPLAVLAANY